mgnify:CR=1 FL=1
MSNDDSDHNLIFDPKIIGDRLLKIRKMKGMSQEETAWATGLSARAYADIERGSVNARLDSGTDVLLDIDVQGAMNVMKDYPKETFIFIRPPSLEELEKRLKGRGTDSAEVISRRLSEAEHEISLADKYGYQVVNDDLDEGVAEVKKIICEEHDKKANDTAPSH